MYFKRPLLLQDSAVTAAKIGTAAVTNAKLAAPKVTVLTETHTAASFTDGGSTSGTKSFAGTIPAGAVVLHAFLSTVTGFAGNTSAAFILGDGTDTDRYNTGTPNIFATAASGLDVGVPSGVRFHDVVKTPIITVTGATDFTPILSGGGSVTIKIFYIQTV
jgi:hypothetical protein